jgi:hypothetical protein
VRPLWSDRRERNRGPERSVAERDTDPLPSAAAAEAVAGAQGRSGVPTGLSTPDAKARATERTGARAVAPQAPKPVGLDTTGRSDGKGATEDADGVTAIAGASCAAGSLTTFQTGG